MSGLLRQPSLWRRPESAMDYGEVAAAFAGAEALPDETAIQVVWYECGRKHQFTSFHLANLAAESVMLRQPVRNNGRTTNLGAYECIHCDGFHFGKQRASVDPPSWRRRVSAARHELLFRQRSADPGDPK